MNETYTNFTVFESFPCTSCCSQNFLPNKTENLAKWIWEVVSGMFTMDGRRGMEWRAKVRVQNGGREQVKPKNQPGRAVLAP